MFDFSQEELFEVIDRRVSQLLQQHGQQSPPVRAIQLLQAAYGYSIRELDPEEEAEFAARGQPLRPARRRAREIVFNSSLGVESRNMLCARAMAKELIPAVLQKLGVAEGTENRTASLQLIGLITPRILLPTSWFDRQASRCGYDLWKLKDIFETASYEVIATRLLDLEEPCLIVLVDDGEVVARRGNRVPATKKLTPAEQRCLNKVSELGEPQTVRCEGWTVRGWPVPTGPFNRIILRSVPDEL